MPRHRETFNEINITPLTDIFLVLLIIMMVIAPLLDQQGLNLTVPDMVEAENVQDSKIMTVTVTAENKYIIDGEEVADSNLENTIKTRAKDYPEGLLIATQSDATHGAVVRVMDIARNVGVTNISLNEI